MQFNVGPVTYTLVVSDRPLYDDEGNEIEGQAVESRRLLLVSRRVEPDRREDVALHELFEAYLFHVPKPQTNDEHSQLFALAAKGFRMDLERQGGPEAIREMVPRRVPHLGKPTPARAESQSAENFGVTDRVPCGGCGADVMCGSVNNGEPVQHEATGQWRILRWMQCDACGVLQTWYEVCTADGVPLGKFVANPAPRLLRGAEASEWIKNHTMHLC